MFIARSAVLFVIAAILISSGCDKGLSPVPPPTEVLDTNAVTGFGGIVYFRNWPRLDSVDLLVQEIRIAAFKNLPVDTSSLFIEFLRGNVIIYPPVGTTAYSKRDSTGRLRDSIHYSIVFSRQQIDSLPTNYAYIALAWRYGPNVFADWRPAGVYTTQPGTFIPGSIRVQKYKFLKNVDIHCDFQYPPPRPWR
jgi:hypothetical protein